MLLLVALALAFLVKTFVVQPFYIPSGSMEQTLQIGDRVLVNKVVYRLRDVQRGDVVVFNGVDSFTPGGDHPRRRPTRSARPSTGSAQLVGFAPPGERDFVKRVIGVAGDQVVCCDEQGRITVNGVPLHETATSTPGTAAATSRSTWSSPRASCGSWATTGRRAATAAHTRATPAAASSRWTGSSGGPSPSSGRSRTRPSWRSRRRSSSPRCNPMTTDTAPAPAPAKKGGLLRDTVIVLIVALLLSVLTRTLLVQAFYVPSGSMLPTLQLQDRILASKLTGGDVQRGDVVVFADPGGWLPAAVPEGGIGGALRTGLTWVGLLPSDADDNLVKRVIGLGGDRVVCCDKGRIEVNGSPLVEPYLAPGGTDQVRFDVVVPADRMFVMGDNRAHSEDSRFHLGVDSGTVPLADVVGPVIAVVWPAANWQRFSPPATFAQVPASRVAPTPSTGGAPGSGKAVPVGPG